MRGHKRCRISRRAEPRDVEAQIGESRFLTRSMSSTDEGRVLCLAQMRSASKNSGYLGNPNGTPENLGEGVRVSGTTDNYWHFEQELSQNTAEVYSTQSCISSCKKQADCRNRNNRSFTLYFVMWATLCACQKSARAKKSPVAVTQSKKKKGKAKKKYYWTCKHIITLVLAQVGKRRQAEATNQRICFTLEKRQDVCMCCWLKTLNTEWGKCNVSFKCWLKEQLLVDPINTSWRTMWLKNTWFDERLGWQNRCKMFNSRRVKSIMRAESGVFVQHPTPAKLINLLPLGVRCLACHAQRFFFFVCIFVFCITIFLGAKYYSYTWQFLNHRLWVFWGFTDLPFYRMDWLEQLIKGRTLLCHGFTKHFSDSWVQLFLQHKAFFFSPFQKLSP